MPAPPLALQRIEDVPIIGEFRSQLHDRLTSVMQASANDVDVLEAHTGDSTQETFALSRLALETNPRTICEVGFNAGHGAASMIVTSRSLHHYIAFDLGERGGLAAPAPLLGLQLIAGRPDACRPHGIVR